MSTIENDKILKDLINESNVLIEQMTQLLEDIEGDFSQVARLAEYGNLVDRIMGGSQSLAMLMAPDHALNIIGDYAALCKAVGYKASQIENNPQLFDVCVALLMDITDILKELIERVDESAAVLRMTVPSTFFDRVKWISEQFKGSFRESIQYGNSQDFKSDLKPGSDIVIGQSMIDQLVKKMTKN